MTCSSIPETGFLRLPHIIGDPTANPPIIGVIPVKKSCWWDGVKSGRFPKPVKLSGRCTAWRAEDIRALIKQLQEQAQQTIQKNNLSAYQKKRGGRHASSR